MYTVPNDDKAKPGRDRTRHATDDPAYRDKPHMAGLTLMQARFVDAYASIGNATQAAKLAGFSELTARTQGPKLLKIERVKGAIAAERITQSGTNWGDAEVLAVLRKEATATGGGTSAAARVAAARAYGEALGLFKRPDLDALASLQRIEIILRLPDGSAHSVGGAALLKPAQNPSKAD